MTALPRRDEAGAGTVLVLAMAAVLCFTALALAGVSGVVRAQRSAQSVADLAALAAAGGAARGDEGCADAGAVAVANGAVLAACDVRAREARVRVEVAGPWFPGRRVTVAAEARAGPGR